jgi:hypothetical protein
LLEEEDAKAGWEVMVARGERMCVMGGDQRCDDRDGEIKGSDEGYGYIGERVIVYIEMMRVIKANIVLAQWRCSAYT